MRSKEVFDRELEQANRVYTGLSQRYHDLDDFTITGEDSDRTYPLLNSVERLIKGLTEPTGPDVLVSHGVRKEMDERLDIIREKLSEVIDILSKYETGETQNEAERTPRIVARQKEL